jgi:RNA polymerase sigma-70 factor (ECF subfamily)
VSEDSDEALARQARVDRTAFAELVRRYSDGIYSLAYRMVGNADDAEDIAQETFLRAYRALGTYDPTRPFRAWLYRIASNLCVDHEAAQRPVLSLEDANGTGSDAATSILMGEEDPQAIVERREVQRLIQQGILALPPHYRVVIVLRYLHGLSYEEIAQTLGLPLNTVRTHLHRGKEALRTWLHAQRIHEE